MTARRTTRAAEPAVTEETPGTAPDAAPGPEQDAPEGHEPALDEAPLTLAQVRHARLLEELRDADARWVAEQKARHDALRAADEQTAARLAAEADAMTLDAVKAADAAVKGAHRQPLSRDLAEALAAAAPTEGNAVLVPIWATYAACQAPPEDAFRAPTEAQIAEQLDGYSTRLAWRAAHLWPALAAA